MENTCVRAVTTVILSFYLGICKAQDYLSVNQSRLMFNNEKVFLSGVNQAWYTYGADFGHNFYTVSKPHLIQTLDAIQKSGGNSIRIWVHMTGSNSPEFNASGHVTGLDKNITRDMMDFVMEAERRNILVTYTLWNCAAVDKNSNMYGLLTSEDKLQSYVTNALAPLVRALRASRALGIWEIINEPEGCIHTGVYDATEPCHDTSTLHLSDLADWTGLRLPLKHMLRFIAVQSQAIHIEDPKALVTVGSWTYKSVTDQLSRRNLFSDECLQLAGGGWSESKLDLYQIHTYDELFIYWPHDPFMINASVYAFDKPVIIGEFSQKKGGLMTSSEQFTWAYYHGYSGAWSWCALDGDDASDSLAVQEKGMSSLKNKDDQTAGGRVNIVIHKPDITTTLYNTLLRVIKFVLPTSAINWFS